PVDDDTDAPLVEAVDEVAEVVRRPITRGGREVGRDLVTPRATVRMLGHGHQLDMGEAEVCDVGDELVSELPVGQARAPRAEMDLVDRQRLLVWTAARSGLHPFLITPGVRRLEDDRCRRWWAFGEEGNGVCLLPPDSVPAEDLVLVLRTGADIGHEEFPQTGAAHRAHRMRAAFPVVEVADDAHSLGVRCPNR